MKFTLITFIKIIRCFYKNEIENIFGNILSGSS